MSSSQCPVELNFLVPFLQRANEIAESQPVMAYYCKFYSVSLALKGGPNKFQRTSQTDTFLAKLFDDLETEKMKLSSHSTIKDLTQGAIYVREFAYRVFLSAEKQESSPSTVKKALQSYLAADPSVLDLSEDEAADELKQVDEKSKFAKWRIVELKKQLNNNTTVNAANMSANLAIHPSPTQQMFEQSHSFPQPQQPQQKSPPPPQAHPQIYSESKVSSPPALLYDPKVINECEKFARHAISALNFDDVETAAESLRSALKTLQPYLKENKK